MILKLKNFQDVKRNRQAIVRRDNIIRIWHKTGVLGGDSPEKKNTSKVYESIKKANEDKTLQYTAFAARRASGK